MPHRYARGIPARSARSAGRHISQFLDMLQFLGHQNIFSKTCMCAVTVALNFLLIRKMSDSDIFGRALIQLFSRILGSVGMRKGEIGMRSPPLPLIQNLTHCPHLHRRCPAALEPCYLRCPTAVQWRLPLLLWKVGAALLVPPAAGPLRPLPPCHSDNGNSTRQRHKQPTQTKVQLSACATLNSKPCWI